ncbi:hypothetical protein MMC10_008059 [Thelotrema lepadinum]|nr:hypothetical protein [Thelotrema lepadinum]
MKRGTSRSGTLKKVSTTRQSSQIASTSTPTRVTLSDVTQTYASVSSLLNSDEGLEPDHLQGYHQSPYRVPSKFTAVTERAITHNGATHQGLDDDLNNVIDRLSSDTICVAGSAQSPRSWERDPHDRGTGILRNFPPSFVTDETFKSAVPKKRPREAASPIGTLRQGPACPKRQKSHLEGIARHVTDSQPEQLPRTSLEWRQLETGEEDVQLVTQFSDPRVARESPVYEPPMTVKAAADVTEHLHSQRTCTLKNQQANGPGSRNGTSHDERPGPQHEDRALALASDAVTSTTATGQLDSPLLDDWQSTVFHGPGSISLGYRNKDNCYRAFHTGEINPAVLQRIRDLYAAKKPGYFEVLRLWPGDDTGDPGLTVPYVEVGENGPYDHVEGFFQQPALLRRCGKGNAEFIVEPVVFKSPWRTS